MTEAVGLRGVADGLGLLLNTESFAARALIGSIVALLLAALVVRLGWVKSRRARRGLVLTPVAAAAAAAVASAGGTFLPPLVVATSGDGESWRVFGHEYTVLRLEWLVIAYVGVASFLLLRRLVSHLATKAYVRRAVECDDPGVTAIVRRLASKLAISAPPLLLVNDCPGGAFTSGTREPVVCIDPTHLRDLDDRELEGLIAHELAHISRHDVALNIAVGVIRDLTFFLAPLHLAARWLREEQEHAADDLASDSTGRPAALASSILKVWEGSSGRGNRMAASMACATMVPATAGVPGRLLPVNRLQGGAKLIAARVVRLIEREATVSTARERIELVALAVLIGALSAVTVVLPATLADSSLLLGQWTRPAARAVESPALATFRALTPPVGADASADQAVVDDACASCLTFESASDWRNGTQPTAPARTGTWAAGGGFGWEDPNPQLRNAQRAEPLWGVDSPTNRVGVFVVH